MSSTDPRRAAPIATVGLIVSHPPDRHLLLDFLQRQGYRVLTDLPTKGHVRAWAQVSLLLVDEGAARGHGKDLSRLKEQAGGEYLPILLLLPSKLASQPWLEAGFDDVLRMPLLHADLLTRVKTHLLRREQTQTRFRSVWESSSDAVALSDEDGIVLAANPAYYDLYGLEPEQVIGQTFSQIFPENFQAQAMEIYREIFESGQRIPALESVVRRADGEERVVETSVNFVLLGAKQRAMLSSVRDITRRKRVEAELRQAKEDLERRVAERTADLSRANLKLKQLAQQVVQAQELERHRIGLELHDQIGQTLTAVGLNLQIVGDMVSDSQVIARVNVGFRAIQLAIDQVRHLSFELRPAVLEHFGLVAALETYLETQAQLTTLATHLTVEPTGVRAPSEVESTCYRIAQEALTNIVRHADAKNVWVELRTHRNVLDFRIRDDGIGFEVRHALKKHGSGLGLSGMQERIKLLDGRLTIQSTPGKGTEIRARIPLAGVQEKESRQKQHRGGSPK